MEQVHATCECKLRNLKISNFFLQPTRVIRASNLAVITAMCCVVLYVVLSRWRIFQEGGSGGNDVNFHCNLTCS